MLTKRGHIHYLSLILILDMYRTERFLLFCDLKVKANLKKKISAYGKA